MDSSQKRDRDRKQRQRRQDKDLRKKARAEQKLQRIANPDAFPLAADPRDQDLQPEERSTEESTPDAPVEGELPPAL